MKRSKKARAQQVWSTSARDRIRPSYLHAQAPKSTILIPKLTLTLDAIDVPHASLYSGFVLLAGSLCVHAYVATQHSHSPYQPCTVMGPALHTSSKP